MTDPAGYRGRRGIGQGYEGLAARFLESKGYRILERNYRTRFGEIDLIARDGDTLVFVEVRMRARPDPAAPIETVTPDKQRRVARVARVYLATHPRLDCDCRFDVIGIVHQPGRRPLLDHLNDAFVLEAD